MNQPIPGVSMSTAQEADGTPIGRIISLVFAAAVCGGTSFSAYAQDYPVKPIQLIVTTGAGGGTDALARMLANALTLSLKQPVIVINKPGANGVIASDTLRRSVPDGHTLLVVQNGHTVNPATVKKLPYDTLADFTPITSLAQSPMVLVSGAHTSVKSLRELVELGRQAPERMSFGNGDATARVATEMIVGGTGIRAIHVNYKGSASSMAELAGGHLSFNVTSMPSTLALHAAGKIHYVALLAAKRAPLVPDIATMAEQGAPGVEYTGWWGVMGPPKMAPGLVKQINAAIHTALSDPEVKKKMSSLYMEPWPQSPEAFGDFLSKDIALNIQLARKAGIEPE